MSDFNVEENRSGQAVSDSFRFLEHGDRVILDKPSNEL
jgi:hypothetical protein